MAFNEIEFLNFCDDFASMSTENLILWFKKRFEQDFDSDMHDFISSMGIEDAVLLLMIVMRFSNLEV